MSFFDGIRRRLSLKDPTGWPLIGASYSGKAVTAQSALTVAAAWACIRLIAETVATLPIGLYRKEADGGRTALVDEPLYELLSESPNADQTAVEYWEAMTAGLCLWGNAYSMKEGSGRRIVSLEYMRPDLTSQRRNSDGNLEFTFNDRGKVEILPEEKVFHIKGFGIDRDFGLSPISYARHTIGAAMGADEATSTIFKNGMWQSGFLTTERVLTAEQREQVRTMLGRFQGTRESGALLLLEAGLDFKPISMPPDDAQMLETRGFSVEEVCRWFRVPPILVGHSPDGQTMWGSGIEQIMIAFLTLSLRPYLRRTKGAIQKRLLYPEQRRKMYADFNVDGLLQADSAGRAALYSSFAQNGIYTRNELREKENQPKKPGGDLLTVQSNMVPLDGLGGNQTDAQKALNLVRDWLRSGEVEGSGT